VPNVPGLLRLARGRLLLGAGFVKAEYIQPYLEAIEVAAK